MEKKRWVLILMVLCLALAFSVSSVEAQDICTQGDFCDSDHDGFWRNHKRCDCVGIIDCNDNDPGIGGPPCGGGDDGDTKTSKKSIPLIMTFDDVKVEGECVDNICSDGDGPLVDNEDRVGVSAGGHSQPNPAAGIHMGLGAKPRIGRQLDLNIICEPIEHDTDGDGNIDISIDNCEDLPPVLDALGEPVGNGFSVSLPDCGVGSGFCDLGVIVRPYKVNCPKKLPNGECPDVFTMAPTTTELMSFKLFPGGGPTVEVASAIGGDSAFDPGRCYSLHPDPAALAEAVCTTEIGTHTTGANVLDLVDTSVEDFADPNLNITVGADIVKNVDDGSQGVIKSISGNTITVTLAGGTVNLWNEGDDYTIVRTSKCNVSVTAFDLGSETGVGFDDGENDEWDVVANSVTALMCNRKTSTLQGKATLTFEFNSKKKE